MTMEGIRDPLGAALVTSALHRELQDLGYTVAQSADLHALNDLKLQVRGERVGAFHDPDVTSLPEDRFFWLSLADPAKKVIALQALRLDIVDTSLSDWAQNYTIGLYMRRQELLVPAHASPPKGSIAERLKGKLVYHGELWVDKSVKNRRISEAFGRLGLLLGLIKWQPDAIWGLVAQSMATHGHVTRIGYSYLERGFFRWQMQSEGIDPVEWIAIAERPALEALVDEMLTTEQPGRRAK
jgi:hypothetical protein